MQSVDPRSAAQRPTGCGSARLLGCGTRSPLYLIGDAASRRGLSRVGYFITINGPLNGHPPSLDLYASSRWTTVGFFDFYTRFLHRSLSVSSKTSHRVSRSFLFFASTFWATNGIVSSLVSSYPKYTYVRINYIQYTDTISDIHGIIKIRKMGAFKCYLRQKSTFC